MSIDDQDYRKYPKDNDGRLKELDGKIEQAQKNQETDEEEITAIRALRLEKLVLNEMKDGRFGKEKGGMLVLLEQVGFKIS